MARMDGQFLSGSVVAGFALLRKAQKAVLLMNFLLIAAVFGIFKFQVFALGALLLLSNVRNYFASFLRVEHSEILRLFIRFLYCFRG
jgi:hypothetical protein